MSFDPVELWHTMTILAKGVCVLLIIMSVYSLTVAIERWIFFSKAKKQSLAFAKLVTLHLKQDKLQEAIESSKKYKQSHLARVVAAGLYEFQHDLTSGTADIVGHELLAWNLQHCRQHARVANVPPAQLLLHHRFALETPIGNHEEAPPV